MDPSRLHAQPRALLDESIPISLAVSTIALLKCKTIMVVVGAPTMRDFKGDETPKLRRFALAIGLVLFIYAIAGVDFKSPLEIAPLGIPLTVRRPNLAGVGLAVASGYAAARYWYYAMVLNVSPVRARRRLRHGVMPDGQTATSEQQLRREAARYFPSPLGEAPVTIGAPPEGGFRIIEIPWKARALAALETIDFTAPIWLNVVALLIYTGRSVLPLTTSMGVN